MPINRLLEGAAFDPAAVKVITAAFDDALRELDLERTDPMAELVARRIIEGAHVGERDPARLRALVVAAYRM